MTQMPGAIWKPVGNYTATTIAHLGVVEHVTAGENDPWGWFGNPSSQASSHLFIGNGQGGVPDGQLEQYVDLDLKAWAEAAGNTSYISVETEGQAADPLTNAQVLTFARIMAFAHTTYGVPLVVTDVPGQRGLILHGDGGAAWGGHTGCPGTLRANQRGQILYIAAQSLDPTPPPTPPSTQENETVTSLISGNYIHVWGVVNNVAYHWYQEIGGHTWGVEKLPNA